MRVLFINYEFPPVGAGAGNALANIARCLARSGLDIVVLTAAFRDLPSVEHRDGYVIRRVPAWRRRVDRCTPMEMLSFVAGGIAPTLAIGASWRPDVACAFFGIPSGPLTLLLKKRFGVPYLVSLRGGDVPGFDRAALGSYHRVTRPVIRAIWKESAGLIANSDGLANLARVTWPTARIDVIPNGVDLERFHPPSRARPSVPIHLLTVGRLVRQKGITHLLSALPRVEAPWQLRIVGDGPERPTLMEQAGQLGLAPFTDFAGWSQPDQLPGHYDWADILIQPSFEEGMSNVVLEGLAAGLPIITTGVYGNRDLVQDGQNGLLVDPGNSEVLARALNVLCSDPNLLRTFGTQSRLIATTRRWETVADAYHRALARAVNGVGGAAGHQRAGTVGG
jgi:glycosyltransferase involved in cell wall biosynthesis